MVNLSSIVVKRSKMEEMVSGNARGGAIPTSFEEI
jgi:hypothetical protein